MNATLYAVAPSGEPVWVRVFHTSGAPQPIIHNTFANALDVILPDAVSRVDGSSGALLWTAKLPTTFNSDYTNFMGLPGGEFFAYNSATAANGIAYALRLNGASGQSVWKSKLSIPGVAVNLQVNALATSDLVVATLIPMTQSSKPVQGAVVALSSATGESVADAAPGLHSEPPSAADSGVCERHTSPSDLLSR